jgi:ribulose-5-phosphate 4-epimerase/fuculose-1-phosphate aldolase
MTLDAPVLDVHDLSALKAMSARVGRDLLLIQGAGGNNSVKIEGVIWVKASGTWLQDAERAPIFLPVDLDLARRRFSAGEEKVAAIPWSRTPAGLRPSIETSLHAFLPQPIVLHVHSVNVIAWCIRAERAPALGDRLQGLNWAWLPYCRPGLPLATQAAALAARGRAPDVLLLGNHGLVVAGADTAATEALLAEVEKRLHLDPRPAPPSRMARLGGLVQGSPYRPAEAAVVHGLERPPAGGVLRFFRVAPIAILTTMLNVGLEAAGLCFLPLYAMSAGWTEERATLLISTLMFGAIVMQIPIGWLGDKVDRRRLAVVLSFLSSAGALTWPVVLHLPWIAFPLLFVWGGLFVGIYTTMLTIAEPLQRRRAGGHLCGDGHDLGSGCPSGAGAGGYRHVLLHPRPAALRGRRLPPLRPVPGDIQTRNLRAPALRVTHEWTGAGRLVIAIPYRRTASSSRVAGDK